MFNYSLAIKKGKIDIVNELVHSCFTSFVIITPFFYLKKVTW